MKEAFSYTNDNDVPNKNQWPSDREEFKAALKAYHAVLSDFARRMHQIFALALGLSDDFFSQTYKPCGAGVRTLHYPMQPLSRDNDEIGIGAHTDYNWFTFIYQDNTGGLEVQTRTGEWIPVLPRDGTLVVNIGDSMQWVSGGKLRSTRHRVMNRTEKERYSMAFFWSPNIDDVLRVAPTCQEEDSEIRGELVVREYTMMRQRGSRLSHPMLKGQ